MRHHLVRCRALLLLVFSVAAGGCATSTPIAAFSAATSTLAKGATDAYSLLDQSTVDRKIADAAATADRIIGDTTFDGLLVANPKLALRMRMVKELGDYAAALLNLATADFRKGIDEASKDLYGALTSLRGTYKTAAGQELPISDGDLAYLATAVDAIGNSIVERRRQQALRDVVIRANPAVQRACKLVAQELPGFTSFVELNLGTVESESITAYYNERSSLSFPQRVHRINQIGDQSRAKRGAAKFFNDVSQGLAQVAETHQALADGAASGGLTTDAIVAGIGSVVDWAREVREFHGQLSKNAEQ